MMPEGFGKMKGKLYVMIQGSNQWSEVEEPCSLNEVLEFWKEQAEKKKSLGKREYEEHLNAIKTQLQNSRIKHPDNKWPWKSFDFVHQVSVMAEEAGEAVREANKLREKDNKANLLSLYNELAQTGAMCVRIMEQIKEYANRN